mmetsp:Transcript_118115/g.235293  ORF Transcript_118115/g.235293 Transcript_118115/m.235293 type:complete len:142 (+) Transcript_118115:152-577(+)
MLILFVSIIVSKFAFPEQKTVLPTEGLLLSSLLLHRLDQQEGSPQSEALKSSRQSASCFRTVILSIPTAKQSEIHSHLAVECPCFLPLSQLAQWLCSQLLVLHSKEFELSRRSIVGRIQELAEPLLHRQWQAMNTVRQTLL